MQEEHEARLQLIVSYFFVGYFLSTFVFRFTNLSFNRPNPAPVNTNTAPRIANPEEQVTYMIIVSLND